MQAVIVISFLLGFNQSIHDLEVKHTVFDTVQECKVERDKLRQEYKKSGRLYKIFCTPGIGNPIWDRYTRRPK